MSPLFFGWSLMLLPLHLTIATIRLCAAARVVLQSHNNNTLSNPFLENNSSVIPTVVEPSAENSGVEGARQEPIIRYLVVALVIYLILTLAFIVVRHLGGPRFPFGSNIRPALTSISGSISRVVRPSLQQTTVQISVLPLHHMNGEPRLSTDPEGSSTPALPPRVHDPRQPWQPSPQFPYSSLSDSPRVLQPETHNPSRYSLAPSETPTYVSAGSDTSTVVRELTP